LSYLLYFNIIFNYYLNKDFNIFIKIKNNFNIKNINYILFKI